MERSSKVDQLDLDRFLSLVFPFTFIFYFISDTTSRKCPFVDYAIVFSSPLCNALMS